MSKKQINALVLSGGAIRGAFEVGVADFLINEKGIYFDVICGTSAGGLNSIMLAQGHNLQEQQAQLKDLKNIWFGIRSSKDLWKQNFLGWIRVFLPRPFGVTSIFNVEPMKKLIFPHLHVDRLKSSPVKFGMGVCSLNSGAYKFVRNQEPKIADYLIATFADVAIFPPVEIDGELYVDGGTRQLLPIKDGLSLLKEIEQEHVGEELEFRMFVSLAELRLKLAPAQTKDFDNGLNVFLRGGQMGQYEFQTEALNSLERQTRLLRDLPDPKHHPLLEDSLCVDSMVIDPLSFPADGITGQFEVNPEIIQALYEHGRSRARTIWEEKFGASEVS